ncbi:hypothetical protein QTV44_003878 [Vibrio vulnificus]|nr:hypothetical protein [Vibrio vulnificus]
MNRSPQFIPSHPLNTAVLFLVFNRLDTTKQVFEAIRKAKPPRLYIAADGARENKEGEAEKVQAVRDFILQSIDWECDVKTLFRDKNIGCKYAVSGAITWFFDNEEQGIILEDDCLPSQSFFWYCEELLQKYKDDDRIFLVSGDSRGAESFGMEEDYGFCKYSLIWGWASWARAWKRYDPELEDWPSKRHILPKKVSRHKATARFWSATFEKLHNKEIDTWDYQFCYLLLKNEGKCIVPKVNLISNIGFGFDATHTFDSNSANANREKKEINIPLTHVYNVESEKRINDFYDKNDFYLNHFIVRVINKFSRVLTGKNVL